MDPSPSPAPACAGPGLRLPHVSARSYRVALLAYEQVQGLRLPLPSQSTVGGPTPCRPLLPQGQACPRERGELNIHGQCPKIGMQKPAYPTDYGLYATGRQWQSARLAASIRRPFGGLAMASPLAEHVPSAYLSAHILYAQAHPQAAPLLAQGRAWGCHMYLLDPIGWPCPLCGQGQGLGLPHPSQFTGGVRRRAGVG